MKTKLGSLRRNVANALLVTLFMMLILAVSIAGYMAYVQQQNKLGTRSQTWNMAMAVAEAGIEEGLEVLNSGITNGPPASGVFTGSGWTLVGTSNYVLGPRNLPGGYYYVTNNMTDWLHPVITSRGFVQMPAVAKGGSQTFFATAGTANTATPMLTRAVQLQAFKGSIYLAAMAALNSINMNGNNGFVDSFNDMLSNGTPQWSLALEQSNGSVASLNGMINVGNYNIYGNLYVGPEGYTVGTQGVVSGQVYQDANFTFPDTSPPDTSGYFTTAPPGTNVVMTSPGTTTNYYSPTVPPAPGANQSMTTNTLWFTNSTYPGAGFSVLTTNYTWFVTSSNPTVLMSSSNLVCGTTWFGPTHNPPANACSTRPAVGNKVSYTLVAGTNVTYVTNGNFTYQTNVTYIYKGFAYTLNTNPQYQTNTYDHVICGDYYLTSASALSGSTLVSCPGSTVVTPNGLSLTGQDGIEIASGSSLSLYVSGGSLNLSGNGVANDGGYAENFAVYCTTNVTSVTLGGNGQFTGTLIAPNATVTMNGGGANNIDVTGAIMASYITLNGHFSFHYPDSLSHALGTGRYLVTSWKEIP